MVLGSLPTGILERADAFSEDILAVEKKGRRFREMFGREKRDLIRKGVLIKAIFLETDEQLVEIMVATSLSFYNLVRKKETIRKQGGVDID